MPITVGSFALVSSKPTQNSGVVEELIKKGLIILAKTNLNVRVRLYISYPVYTNTVPGVLQLEV